MSLHNKDWAVYLLHLWDGINHLHRKVCTRVFIIRCPLKLIHCVFGLQLFPYSYRFIRQSHHMDMVKALPTTREFAQQLSSSSRSLQLNSHISLCGLPPSLHLSYIPLSPRCHVVEWHPKWRDSLQLCSESSKVNLHSSLVPWNSSLTSPYGNVRGKEKTMNSVPSALQHWLAVLHARWQPLTCMLYYMGKLASSAKRHSVLKARRPSRIRMSQLQTVRLSHVLKSNIGDQSIFKQSHLAEWARMLDFNNISISQPA